MLPTHRFHQQSRSKNQKNFRFALIAICSILIIGGFFYLFTSSNSIPAVTPSIVPQRDIDFAERPRGKHAPAPEIIQANPVTEKREDVCVLGVCLPRPSPGWKPSAPAGVDKDSEEMDKRRKFVQSAAEHAWNGYATHAFGHDEIRPETNATNDSWGGFGVTLVDAMDTLYILGLEEQFKQAREHATQIKFDLDYNASFFETSIRYLGGMLGAFAVSGDQLFVEAAERVGSRLMPAFNTTTGIPYSIVNLLTGAARNPKWTQGASILAEAGSVQLEFASLGAATKKADYDDKSRTAVLSIARAAIKEAEKEGVENGVMFPVFINPATNRYTTDHISMGGLGDSFYEILLKAWVLTGRELERALYLSSVRGMRAKLIQTTPTGMTYVGEFKQGRHVPRMDHLTCYVPGMLALGHISGAHPKEDAPALLELAEALMDTCVALYDMQPSGLGPETVRFDSAGRVTIESARYLLRPETMESLMYLYRATGKERYRDAGWRIFEAIHRNGRTPAAYSGVLDVTQKQTKWDNSMQSFFMAETLKYAFLLFSPSTVIPLDEFVFTTEAHPLRILKQ